MNKTVLHVPKMYADHHVQAVRNALLQLDGVEEVMASSAFKVVQASYDPDLIKAAAIEEKLRAAGYGPDEDWELPELPEPKEDESPWFQSIWRKTRTDPREIEMAGDFRLY